jgi:hypothetical protein
MSIKKYLPFIGLLLVILSFFTPSFLSGRLPIPSDTIVGLYHPYRDFFNKEYPRGIPFKNFLITDPVRQQYPWKYLAVSEEKKLALPLWNPYAFAGTPLLANFQSGALYPVNLLLFFNPFHYGWLVYIFLQPLLAGAFLYLYLRNLRVSQIASALGGFVFAYCGFSVAWMEWGNIGHTALWLPVVLLSIDKAFETVKNKTSSKLQVKIQNYLLWCFVLIAALTSSFFAGHLQTFFYLFITAIVYVLVRWVQSGRKMKSLAPFALSSLLFAVLTAVQWYPTLQFIAESARSVDQANWRVEGWFLPWQHLVQFLMPDFFGNPTTMNYFGVWNYGEFIGYIGIFPLLLSSTALLFRRDKKTYFFAALLLVSLLFALPTTLARLPYEYGLPFLSTAQPTRLLFLIDFSLAVLCAFGFDYFRNHKKSTVIPLIIFTGIFISLWGVLLFVPSVVSTVPENIAVVKRNMQLPTVVLFGTGMVLLSLLLIRNTRFRFIVLLALLVMTIADISRFTGKFTPFTDAAYLYPRTETITFLQKHLGNHRYMTTDSRILPPNFSAMYTLQTVDGYDPLFLRRYGELIVASERKKPDISPPFGFNRIITPHEYDSRIIDLLGVKYILSLSDLSSPKLKKVFQEGETRVYENSQVMPRVFFVEKVSEVPFFDKEEAISFLFDTQHDLRREAIINLDAGHGTFATGSAEIISYSPSSVRIRTKLSDTGFLILTDTHYPTWKARLRNVDGSVVDDLSIIRTDYHFRGVVVPKGTYIVEFTNTQL